MSNGSELSAPASRQPIRFSTVLVVEGRDMFGFFLALLREMKLDSKVEVRNGGGTPQLYDYLAVLPNISGFDAVTSLGIVCDCETDPGVAFADLCNALRRASLAVPTAPLKPVAIPPPEVCVALLPDPHTPGMLETLLWRTLMTDPIRSCINDYLDCVRLQTGRSLAYEDKSRIAAYIAGRDDPWFLLGQAVRAGYFPWTSPEFDEVKGFLQGLAATSP